MGIGFASAKAFVEEGATIVILVGCSREALAAASAEFAGGGRVRTFTADPADEAARTTLAEAFGYADVLANDAGAMSYGFNDDIDINTWRAEWELKVFGVPAADQIVRGGRAAPLFRRFAEGRHRWAGAQGRLHLRIDGATRRYLRSPGLWMGALSTLASGLLA